MIRLIHLSDLHIRSRSTRMENENAKALVDDLIDRYGSGPKSKTVVVLTGDLVDDGKEKQYENLEEVVLTPLRRAFQVVAVPGNHDYALWGNVFDEDARARFDTHVRKIPPYPMPWVDKIVAPRERKVLFIGVDSADPGDKEFLADGIVDAEQRAEIGNILDDTEYRDFFKVVYVHHHPFLRHWFVAFQEAEAFLRLIRGKVGLVLFGHKHVHESFWSRYGISTMVASGKVTAPVADALAYRVIELDRTGSPRVSTAEPPAT